MMLSLPHNFISLTEIDPTIIECVRYHSDQNFLGRQVNGYKTSKIICTHEAAYQLREAHEYFKAHGYKLVVYDGYRPQRAVNDFRSWGHDLRDDKMKAYYYPALSKEDLFKGGYVPGETSQHSRGSAFDLTLIKTDQRIASITYLTRVLENGEEIPFLDDNTVDMGSSFDLFDEASHHSASFIHPRHKAMRRFLCEGMKKFGFEEYENEWWHYKLSNEPYPDTYFDFVVEE